jgi:monothiol glutaredoxin
MGSAPAPCPNSNDYGYIFLEKPCSAIAVSPMTPELKERIDSIVNQNKVVVFMKGNKLMPQCGFSNNVVQILNMLGVPYETVDVLEDYDIRQGIKEYSSWPTIPQVYINGQFIGGSDIMIELYQKGELQQMVEVALAS